MAVKLSVKIGVKYLSYLLVTFQKVLAKDMNSQELP